MSLELFLVLGKVFRVAVGSSGILNFDKQDVISKMASGPQKQIHKNSCRSFVFWAKNYKGLLFNQSAKGNLIKPSQNKKGRKMF